MMQSGEQIDQVLVGYCFRWPAELSFKTLKSGLKIKDMKYQTLERYVKAFSMLAVMIFLHGRASVDASTPPTIEHFMKSIAKLGGYIDKKAQGPPGSITIWRGMSRFETIVQAFLACA